MTATPQPFVPTLAPLDAPRQSGTSYIETHEELQARSVVAAEFQAITGSAELPRATGYYLCLKLHIRDEELAAGTDVNGNSFRLIRPTASLDDDKYQSVVGLVVSVGPQAYKGKNVDGSERFPEGPFCKVGDFVVIPRYESFLVMWKAKVALAVLPDDKVMMVVRDPTDVAAPHMADLI